MEHVADDKTRFWLKVRIGLVAAVFAIGFLTVIGRVYYLQTVESEALEERVAGQRNAEVTRQARRGDIIDRNGQPLAVSVEVPSIFARPKLLGDRHRAASRLADILDASEAEIADRLDTDSPFVWLERQAHPRVAEEIEELDIPGLGSMDEYQRYYPMGPLAGQLLGFVGIDGEGLEGIERQFDSELAGGDYQLRVTRDARGRQILVSDTPRFGQFEGNSVHLTIDEKIQQVTHDSLARQVEEFDARGGYAIAMEVDTGDILSMSSMPAFDPNRFSDFTSGDWRLAPVTDTFEPGSVFKPFLLAAALQDEAVTLDTVYDGEHGRMRIGADTIGDIMVRDEFTAAEVIQKSSNIGSYKMAQDLGRHNYYDYIRSFGFGTRTGVGLRGEQSGVVWPAERWAEITFANVAFGQGLSATPLQLVTGMAALANGGMLLEPRVVDEIRDRNGQLIDRKEPTMVRRVVSPDVAEQVAWAMSLVTTDDGTGSQGDIDHFTVAAKTGTAQQVDPETRQYDPDGWVSGYIGFVPAEDPEIAIAVFVDSPQEERYGGRVAGPAFADIAEQAMSQRGTLPLAADERFDRGEQPTETSPSDIAQPAPDDTIVLPAMRILDRHHTGDVEDGMVPNFSNLTLRQAIDQARDAGIIPRITGWGLVTEQMPPPGTPIEEAPEVRLTLSPQTESNIVNSHPSDGGVDEEQ